MTGGILANARVYDYTAIPCDFGSATSPRAAHEGERSDDDGKRFHALSRHENPARVRTRRGPGNPHGGWVLGEGIPSGKHLGAVNIPHGTSGTNSPEGIRS